MKKILLTLAVTATLFSCKKTPNNNIVNTCTCTTIQAHSIKSISIDSIYRLDTTITKVYDISTNCSSLNIEPHWVAYSNVIGDINDSLYRICK